MDKEGKQVEDSIHDFREVCYDLKSLGLDKKTTLVFE